MRLTIASNRQSPTGLPQTLAQLLHVGHRFGHQTPEILRVVQMRQVRHLVDDYVLHERRIQHHDPPVETQRTVGSAACPTSPLVTDENP